MMIDAATEKCRLLRLKTCVENLQTVVEMAAQKNWPALKVIDHLFALELEARLQSKIALRFKQSKLLKNPPSIGLSSTSTTREKNKKGKSCSC